MYVVDDEKFLRSIFHHQRSQVESWGKTFSRWINIFFHSWGDNSLNVEILPLSHSEIYMRNDWGSEKYLKFMMKGNYEVLRLEFGGYENLFWHFLRIFKSKIKY